MLVSLNCGNIPVHVQVKKKETSDAHTRFAADH